jgi:hypothetical protein
MLLLLVRAAVTEIAVRGRRQRALAVTDEAYLSDCRHDRTRRIEGFNARWRCAWSNANDELARTSHCRFERNRFGSFLRLEADGRQSRHGTEPRLRVIRSQFAPGFGHAIGCPASGAGSIPDDYRPFRLDTGPTHASVQLDKAWWNQVALQTPCAGKDATPHSTVARPASRRSGPRDHGGVGTVKAALHCSVG